MPKVNPHILIWARDTAGLTIKEATEKLDLNQARGVSAVDRLAALEAGEQEPTRPMLVKMAKQYRRPLLTFYMSAPPRKGDRGQDFRTLPEDHSMADEALLDVLIRDIRARQSMIRAVLEAEEETEPVQFVGTARMSEGVSAVLASIRETLKVDLAEFRAKPCPVDAFALLRARVEAAGVFVLLIGNLGSYHTTIDLETFRGLTLADEVAPFVIINDHDSRAAWSFTLLHELTHLWLGQTGVSGASAEKAIEIFCNEVASEFLLSREELAQLEINDTMALETAEAHITEFAHNYNLSSSMVAYKLYLSGTIELETWRKISEAFRNRWLQERLKQRERTGKQKIRLNSNIVRRHRVGKALVELIRRMMATGALTTTKAGKVLGVKAKNVQNLIDMGRSHTASQRT